MFFPGSTFIGSMLQNMHTQNHISDSYVTCFLHRKIKLQKYKKNLKYETFISPNPHPQDTTHSFLKHYKNTFLTLSQIKTALKPIMQHVFLLFFTLTPLLRTAKKHTSPRPPPPAPHLHQLEPHPKEPLSLGPKRKANGYTNPFIPPHPTKTQITHNHKTNKY